MKQGGNDSGQCWNTVSRLFSPFYIKLSWESNMARIPDGVILVQMLERPEWFKNVCPGDNNFTKISGCWRDYLVWRLIPRMTWLSSFYWLRETQMEDQQQFVYNLRRKRNPRNVGRQINCHRNKKETKQNNNGCNRCPFCTQIKT